MNMFEIKDQKKLALSKCLELVLSGIQFRLFRAVITVAIVALAVAFLMTIVGDSLIGRRAKVSLVELTKPRQTLLFWAHRLASPMDDQDISNTISAASPGDNRWEEFKTWGACDDITLSRIIDIATQEALYMYFFAELREGKRRALVGRARGREIFAALQTKEALDNFVEQLPKLGKQLPAKLEDFKRFLKDWSDTAPIRRNITSGHGKALAAVQGICKNKPIMEALAEIDEEMLAALKTHGFSMSAEDMATVKILAVSSLKTQRIQHLLKNMVFKQRFATKYGVKDLNKVSPALLFGKISSRSGAQWFLDTMKEINEPFKMNTAQIREAARDQIARNRLIAMEADLLGSTEKTVLFGFSNRMLWLIIVSLIVCIVGITNAMLMSVTELFNEIATMKCLGATDGFIMINFVIESGIQGFSGGVIGGLLGAFLGILRSVWSYGWIAAQNFPVIEMVTAFALCVAAGIILSVIAAIYPAWVAARLAPMEAMRVE